MHGDIDTDTGIKGVHTGLVVSTTGCHILVQDAVNALVLCHPRGKKNHALVGDQVHWRYVGDGGVVEKICPRRNIFFRQDATRTKSFAANIDQILFFIAARPVFSEWQLARALIAAKAQNVPVFIVLNKSDLHVPFAKAWQRLLPYQHMGYAVFPLTLKGIKKTTTTQAMCESTGGIDSDALQAITAVVRGKNSLILGPSGVGKSSLINHLVANAQIMTQKISQALNSGKHTTTATTWFWASTLGVNTALIDSPGFQGFGLNHLNAQDVTRHMPDIARYEGECRFHNCRHLHEPGCQVRAAVGTNKDQITASRYKIYQALYQELAQKKHY